MPRSETVRQSTETVASWLLQPSPGAGPGQGQKAASMHSSATTFRDLWLHSDLSDALAAQHEHELGSTRPSSLCAQRDNAVHAQQFLQWLSVWQQSDKEKYARRPPSSATSSFASINGSQHAITPTGSGSSRSIIDTFARQTSLDHRRSAKPEQQLLFSLEL